MQDEPPVWGPLQGVFVTGRGVDGEEDVALACEHPERRTVQDTQLPNHSGAMRTKERVPSPLSIGAVVFSVSEFWKTIDFPLAELVNVPRISPCWKIAPLASNFVTTVRVTTDDPAIVEVVGEGRRLEVNVKHRRGSREGEERHAPLPLPGRRVTDYGDVYWSTFAFVIVSGWPSRSSFLLA